VLRHLLEEASSWSRPFIVPVGLFGWQT
jgi:hypothetical protein